VKLREDKARGRWVVLAPERMFVPDETALEVLRLVDGARSVDAIVDALAAASRAARGDRGRRVRDAGDLMERAWSRHETPPLALLAELTHRCPLRCPYCSNPVELTRASGARHRDLGARVRRKRPHSACCSCICRAASRRRGATSWRSLVRHARRPGSTPT
jgi:coenzyme PQQ biosynthesis protein PqqD